MKKMILCVTFAVLAVSATVWAGNFVYNGCLETADSEFFSISKHWKRCTKKGRRVKKMLFVCVLWAVCAAMPAVAELPLPFDYLPLVDQSLVDTPCGDRNTGVEFVIPDSALIQNGGKFLNVQNPPAGVRKAAGDGVADDTEALKDALDYMKDVYVKDGWYGPNIYLYFPNGTYLVSDTVFYRGDAVHIDKWGGVSPPRGPNIFDLCAMRLMGQNREKTIIKLANGASGFGNPAEPKAVIKNYHETVRVNNAASKNMINNLTIDTGVRNPGAVGLTLVSANRCGVSNVRIKSGDGQGVAGFWVKIACILGMVQDVTIDGFDYGVKFDVPQITDMQTVGFDHITLKDQNKAGLHFKVGSTAVRKALSLQSKKGVPAAEGAAQNGAQLVVLDSRFVGNDSSICAVSASSAKYEHIYARNVKTEGYNGAVSVAGEMTVSSADVVEYSSIPVEKKTAGLVVEDFPVLRFPELSQWVSSDAFGAVGDGEADDTAAIQQALNSGLSLVYFPKGKYKFTTLRVPKTVTTIYGMGASLEGIFLVDEASDQYLTIHDVYENKLAVELHAQRNMVLYYGRCVFSNLQNLPVKIHISTMVSVDNNHKFCTGNTLVYARSINTESMRFTDFTVDGGILWCLTFKTEHKPQSAFVIKNGGFAEIMSGFISVPTAMGWQPRGIHAFVTEKGGLSLIAATTQECGFYEPVCSEGTVYDYIKFPQRLEKSAANRFIPLFINY